MASSNTTTSIAEHQHHQHQQQPSNTNQCRSRQSFFKLLSLIFIGFVYIFVPHSSNNTGLSTKTIGLISSSTSITMKTNTTTITNNNKTNNNNTNINININNNNNNNTNTNIKDMKIITKSNPIIKEKKQKKQKTNYNFNKQYILHLHYHKTGHAISFQYGKILKKLLMVKKVKVKKGNRNKDKNRKKYDDGEDYNILSGSIVNANGSIHKLKRIHSNETGCPTKKQFWDLLTNETTTTPRNNNNNKGNETETETETVLINYVNSGSIDLFCNIYDNDIFNTQNDDGDGDGDVDGSEHEHEHEQEHDIKIIHMVRDPIDMVVSAYLYHSQSPTPESWVKQKNGVNYNPCNINYGIIKFYEILKLTNTNTNANANTNTNTAKEDKFNIISQKEANEIEELCHTLMYNNQTQKPYINFFQALLKLSSIDGLKLMTIQLLLSNFHSGSDLLRMVLNIISLNEWSSSTATAYASDSTKLDNTNINTNNNNKILTLEMGNDWSRNYTETVTRTTQFIVDDLEELLLVSQQQQQQQQQKINSSDNNNNNNSKKLKSMNKSKIKFIDTVTSMMNEQYRAAKIKNDKHFTSSSKWSTEERNIIIEQLTSDELLGPILFKLQKITNNAIGLT